MYPAYFSRISACSHTGRGRSGRAASNGARSAYVICGRRRRSARLAPDVVGAVPRETSMSASASDGGRCVRSSRSHSASTARYFSSTASYRASEIRPMRWPMALRRSSALSCRCNRRYSEREVMMRYGSFVPFVTRSSISVPMYPSERRSTIGVSPLSCSAAFTPATKPCTAASSYPDEPLNCPAP